MIALFYQALQVYKCNIILVLTRNTVPDDDIPGLQKVNPDHNTKYKKNYGAHKQGMTVQEVAEYYSSWAADYEKVHLYVNSLVTNGLSHPY